MNQQELSTLNKLVEIGRQYPDDWRLTELELGQLALKAQEQLSSMNGDSGTIEISVRQFALLLVALSESKNV